MQTTLKFLILVVIALFLCTSLEAQVQFRGGTFGMGGSAYFGPSTYLKGSFGQTVAGSTGSISMYHDAGFWKPVYGFIFVSIPAGDPGIPAVFELSQNYPNPFNPSTIIRYGLPHTSTVSLIVFNTLGQKVAELVNGTQVPGYHEVRFEGTTLASGVYFYRIRAGDFVQTRKLMLLR
jgi:hypothetical protein